MLIFDAISTFLLRLTYHSWISTCVESCKIVTVPVGVCLIYTAFFHQEMFTVKCDTVSIEKVSSYTVIKKTLRGSVSKNCSKCNINVHIYCILFYQNDFSRYWPLDSHKKYSICNNSNQKYCMIFLKDKIEIKNTV